METNLERTRLHPVIFGIQRKEKLLEKNFFLHMHLAAFTRPRESLIFAKRYNYKEAEHF